MLQTRNISKWKEILEIYFKIVKISYPSSVILNETSCTIGIDNRIARVEGRFKGRFYFLFSEAAESTMILRLRNN